MSALTRRLLKMSPHGIFIVRRSNQKILFMNRAAKMGLGLMNNWGVRPFVDSILSSKSFDPKRLPDIKILEQDGFYQDVKLKVASGKTIPAHVWVQSEILRGQEIVVCHFQNVTTQKKVLREIQMKQETLNQAFRELQEQNEMLRELALMKIKFIAMISHELRNPLSGLLTTMDILSAGIWRTETQLQELHETAREQTQQLNQYVTHILDFSRLESGSTEFFVELTQIPQLVQSQMVLMEGLAHSRGLKFEFVAPKPRLESESEVNDSRGYEAWVDVFQMKQVINNVLSNAIKFNQPEGAVIVWIEATKEEVVIHFKDHGCGIPEGHEQKVFAEFERIGSTMTGQEGYGLGMAISRQIVKELKGRIWYDSQLGEGTCFHVAMPKRRLLPDSMYRSRIEDFGNLLDPSATLEGMENVQLGSEDEKRNNGR